MTNDEYFVPYIFGYWEEVNANQQKEVTEEELREQRERAVALNHSQLEANQQKWRERLAAADANRPRPYTTMPSTEFLNAAAW
jgi:hypothetical protein